MTRYFKDPDAIARLTPEQRTLLVDWFKEEERKKQIETLVPDLKKLMVEKNFKTKTAVFEGFEGFKKAFKKIIDDCPIGGTINILGFSKQQFATN